MLINKAAVIPPSIQYRQSVWVIDTQLIVSSFLDGMYLF